MAGGRIPQDAEERGAAIDNDQRVTAHIAGGERKEPRGIDLAGM
jgi:hypothetical protein